MAGPEDPGALSRRSRGCAVLPPLAGALYDRAGGPAALGMAAGVALTASLTLALFRRALGTAPLAGRPVDRTA